MLNPPQDPSYPGEDSTMAILPRRTRRPGSSFIRNRHGSTWIVVLLVLAGLLLVGGIVWYLVWANRTDSEAAPILHKVERGLFNHVVSEQGEVESSKNIEL